MAQSVPPSVARLLWDVEVDSVDVERDRNLIIERVMGRGTWDAMKWLRVQYSREVLAEFVLTVGVRRLSPRDLAYWALVTGVELPSRSGGGRPSWA